MKDIGARQRRCFNNTITFVRNQPRRFAKIMEEPAAQKTSGPLGYPAGVKRAITLSGGSRCMMDVLRAGWTGSGSRDSWRRTVGQPSPQARSVVRGTLSTSRKLLPQQNWEPLSSDVRNDFHDFRSSLSPHQIIKLKLQAYMAWIQS